MQDLLAHLTSLIALHPGFAAAIGIVVLLLFIYVVAVAGASKRRPKPTLKIQANRITPLSESAGAPGATQAGSNWWKALSKTREKFFQVSASSQKVEALREALEEACLVSDLGVGNTEEALNSVRWADISALPEAQRLDVAKAQLSATIRPWLFASQKAAAAGDEFLKLNKKPQVIWFVGVNGVGKTTSIAKMASELKNRGNSVLLAAGDTFRAAASEQLEIWAERLQVPVVRGVSGADSSAVLFDAIQSAIAKNVDFVLCDSAGRLHNQNQLMEALAKNRRVMDKALPGAPHEVLLVLDANTGQNMLSQAEHFVSTVGVTGLILTKLDGTARGGAVVAVARKTGLPIRRLGLGETANDFVAFDAESFSTALLGLEETAAGVGKTSDKTTGKAPVLAH